MNVSWSGFVTYSKYASSTRIVVPGAWLFTLEMKSRVALAPTNVDEGLLGLQ